MIPNNVVSPTDTSADGSVGKIRGINSCWRVPYILRSDASKSSFRMTKDWKIDCCRLGEGRMESGLGLLGGGYGNYILKSLNHGASLVSAD